MGLRILHAIHDFLPRHMAGSEIYAYELARELALNHDVSILTAEFDATAPHGAIRWRKYDALPVIEIVNNWRVDRFEETYRSPRLNTQLAHVLDIARPDVLHVHNLLNLSFDLPRLARERSIPCVATLHDYTLVCASGGQRVHVAESHVCDVIDTARCARCFRQSPFQTLIAGGAIAGGPVGRLVARAGMRAKARLPRVADAALRRIPVAAASTEDLSRRLSYARHVFDTVDLFVAPSAALASEYLRLGLDPARIRVSGYGFPPAARVAREPSSGPLRIGFVGTIIWHKGAHVLLEAARTLTGAFELLVFGDPRVDPEYFAGLRRQAVGLPVRFLGAFDRADMPRAYGSLDVLVVPSLWPENAPLVIQEAFMHGVPVVGARMGGIPEFVDHGVNGMLYEASSPVALAAALQPFLDDRELATRLAAHLRPVKTIAQDAREWEARYAEVTDGAARVSRDHIA